MGFLVCDFFSFNYLAQIIIFWEKNLKLIVKILNSPDWSGANKNTFTMKKKTEQNWPRIHDSAQKMKYI